MGGSFCRLMNAIDRPNREGVNPEISISEGLFRFMKLMK
jgi:hypothetical protein